MYALRFLRVLFAYSLAFWCQWSTKLQFNKSNENKDTEGKIWHSEDIDGDHLKNVEGGNDEHIVKKLNERINAKPNYSVVTSE